MPDLKPTRFVTGAVVCHPPRLHAAHGTLQQIPISIVEGLGAGMPTSWPCCLISSAFNPQAISQRQGCRHVAVHARHRHLTSTSKQNAFRDDRRDVLASTRAALDYLQSSTACSATGTRPGRLQLGRGRCRAHCTQPNPGPGHWLHRPEHASRNSMYVPQAAGGEEHRGRASAVQHPICRHPCHPYFQSVGITRDIGRREASRRIGRHTAGRFPRSIPSLHKPVILSAGMPQILLPWDNAQVFPQNLAAYSEGPVRQLDRVDRALTP